VGLIRDFRAKCREGDYTDTGDAWDVLDQIEMLWKEG
jgi:hypothetical protein